MQHESIYSKNPRSIATILDKKGFLLMRFFVVFSYIIKYTQTIKKKELLTNYAPVKYKG